MIEKIPLELCLLIFATSFVLLAAWAIRSVLLGESFWLGLLWTALSGWCLVLLLHFVRGLWR